MSDLKNWGYALPIPRELHQKLEKKRKEYLNRISEPTANWSSWQQCDLRERHDLDRDFRFLYYKFVILSAVLLANERYEEKKKLLGDNDLIVASRYIYFNLRDSLGREPSVKIFESACEVVENYLTGKTSLE